MVLQQYMPRILVLMRDGLHGDREFANNNNKEFTLHEETFDLDGLVSIENIVQSGGS